MPWSTRWRHWPSGCRRRVGGAEAEAGDGLRWGCWELEASTRACRRLLCRLATVCIPIYHSASCPACLSPSPCLSLCVEAKLQRQAEAAAATSSEVLQQRVADLEEQLRCGGCCAIGPALLNWTRRPAAFSPQAPTPLVLCSSPHAHPHLTPLQLRASGAAGGGAGAQPGRRGACGAAGGGGDAQAPAGGRAQRGQQRPAAPPEGCDRHAVSQADSGEEGGLAEGAVLASTCSAGKYFPVHPAEGCSGSCMAQARIVACMAQARN